MDQSIRQALGIVLIVVALLLLAFLFGLVTVFRLSAAQVVGTDVFHAAILVSVTAIAHAQGGAVDWPLTVALLAGSIPGWRWAAGWLRGRPPASCASAWQPCS